SDSSARSPFAASAPPTHPAPPVVCGTGYPGYYALPDEVWPLDPNFEYQGPCHFAAADEVHGSFASGASGSGERWSIPWTLPSQGTAGQQNIEDGLYVGMVVSGDPNSMWNQSYLEVLATPLVGSANSLTWTVQVAVLSFANMSSFDPVGCPSSSYNLSWNDSYFCEFDDLLAGNPISMLSGISGGTALAVTFDGQMAAATGLGVWVNETSGSLNTSFVQLNVNGTGTYAFEPAYPSACAQSCFLTWGLSYGLGVGVDICPWAAALTAPCDSYNGTAYSSLPPVTFGSPEFWNGTGYGNDYRYLQPESASGVCDTNPPLGVVTAACYEFTGNGGDGFYPYFSLTGTGLAFGRTYGASVTTYGGAYGQFLDTPGTQDLNPLVETDLLDSSLAGYIAPGGAINVSLNVTDLGSISSVTLAWSANGSAWTTDSLAGTGTNSARSYAGTIPSGPNGPVRYQANATNEAGLTVSSSVRSVLRGPLPSFSVGVGIVPGGCGSVSIGGQPYLNGSVAVLGPGPVPILASGCYPFNFSSWQVTPGLSVAPLGANAATLTVATHGNLTAEFTYLRPTEELVVHVAPAGCGQVVIDGSAYSNGASVPLLFGLSHNLSATVSCAGYAFGGWTPGANVTVLGTSLVVLNNGTLNATLVPTSETSPVTFVTNPSACGGVGLEGAGYTTGESVYLAPGAYPLTPEPCAHFGFANFTTRGAGVSVSGTTLTVGGNGTVIESNFHLTEAYVDSNPAGCGGIVLDGTTYGNGVYVPLENHSAYTVSAFTCAGHYLDAFSASGGLALAGSLLTVNGSGTLLVVSLTGTASIFVGFVTTPAACGEIELNGTEYSNGAFVSLSPDQRLAIEALPCSDYGVIGWAVTGEIAIVGGEAYLNGSGAITALFGALVAILFDTVPTTCGATLIDGVPYADSTSATLIEGLNYSIAPAPCAHYELEQFESSPYVAIQNSSIAPDGPSTITAVFVPIPYSVVTTVVGPGCGTVTLEGAPVGSGDVFNLTVGSYPLAESPCLTSEFAGFTLSSNLSVSVGRLFVNGSGSLAATFLPILPSLTLGGNAGAYVGGTTLFYAAVQVPVATTGYTYFWSFGDGTSNTTSANTSTHVFQTTGTFTVSVEVTDPFHHSANASLEVTVVARPTTSYGGALTTGLLVLGIAAVVLVAVALIARRRAPPPPSVAEARGSGGMEPPDEPPAPPS
ncbi:MAG: PKD domain-containing protein, partial [Thermoplasmata archaeon]